ncbi:MAG TPA: heme-binding protein [Anaeromyxobacteraceae bacterium]|nr:heme-binding protein [Anaeromyxobacteraceae bacterium]
MTTTHRLLAAAALLAADTSCALAQTPAPDKAAAASAVAPLTEKNVSMHMALAIMEGVLEQCTKDGFKVSVVIVGNDGLVRASVRGDGTSPHTMEFARRKAYTARTRNMTSLEFMKQTDKPENAYLKQIPEVVAVGGGVPIRAGNAPIGAVGVSGAPGGEKDEVCANAGIAKVAEALK